MKKYGYVVIVILIIVIGLLLTKFFTRTANVPSQTNQQIQNSLSLQTNEEGTISVTVTPTQLVRGKDAEFQISLNTHSVPLEFDLAKISTLVDDKGNSYDATSWNGGSGGHHLNGNLTFKTLSASVQSVTLTLKGIENKDRVFKWTLP